MARLEWLFYLLIPASVLVHLFVSPYTKVEESFNIQAIHDILIHGIPTENASQFFDANYDHVSFPGSVPRTFAGALILSGLSRPWVGLLSTPAQLQLLVRAVLGVANSIALIAFGRSVQKAFGTSAGVWYALLQASQFHVIYYASRTLPNMFALVFSTTALKCLLDVYPIQWNSIAVSKRYRLALYLLTFSGVVFRSEIAILVSSITLYLFASGRISITGVIIPAGLAGVVIGLLCSVSIDSFFWQSFPLWPEWIGFYYNTIQGHSADWGVSPWHFYFSNALPRLLMNPLTYLLCIPTAIMNAASRKQSLDLIVPSMAFVAIYSLLPHKEWRFIVYVVPTLTAVAAAGASWIWTRRAKSLIYATLSLALVGSVFLSFTASTALLAISSLNYPGGEALNILHNQIRHPEGRHLYVYFDNLACQTGVTRFLERHDGPQTIIDVLEIQNTTSQRTWTYSKTEYPEALLDPTFWHDFDYVLAERPEKVIGSWDIIHTVYGYSGIQLLRPGDKSGGAAEPPNDSTVRLKPSESVTIAQAWEAAEGMLRNTVLRGWWVTIRMEPKIRILKNSMKGPDEWIET